MKNYVNKNLSFIDLNNQKLCCFFSVLRFFCCLPWMTLMSNNVASWSELGYLPALFQVQGLDHCAIPDSFFPCLCTGSLFCTSTLAFTNKIMGTPFSISAALSPHTFLLPGSSTSLNSLLFYRHSYCLWLKTVLPFPFQYECPTLFTHFFLALLHWLESPT